MTAPNDPFATPSGDTPPPSQPPSPPSFGQQPGYGQPGGYGQQYGEPQPGFGTPPAPKRNGLGTAALVLGVLALLSSITVVGGIVLGLLAIVFGIIGRGRASRGEADNGGMAVAGLVLGALGLLAAGALVAFGVSLYNSESGQELQDCLRTATTAEQQAQCQSEFEDSVVNS